MKNLLQLLTACFLFTACGNVQPSTATTDELVTVMTIPATIKAGSPITLKFAVYNRSSKELKFCKWHTPFEGFIAQFLDITDANGNAAQYRGAMAKRTMPPPEEAYIKIPPGDSVTVDIDLLKGYDLSVPGKYKTVYQGGGVSGLVKVNEVTFNLAD